MRSFPFAILEPGLEKRSSVVAGKRDGRKGSKDLKFCLADFVYLIQELRSDCVHLSSKYAKIIVPYARFLNQVNKIREAEL